MFDYLINYLLVGKLLGPALRHFEKQVRAQWKCPLFIADYWVQCDPNDPGRPLAVRAQDKRRVPIVSMIEERLEMLDRQHRVVFSLAPSQNIVTLDGPLKDPKTVALNLPEYRSDRVIVVYPEVLRWTEERCKRPTSDLMTFGNVRMFEMGEDGAAITCGELRGAVRKEEESAQRLTSIMMVGPQNEIPLAEPEVETPLSLDIADLVEPFDRDCFKADELNAIYQTKKTYQMV